MNNFGWINDGLQNLPKEIPRPAEYGLAPPKPEIFATSMAKQVVERGGFVADHFLHGLHRGKGPNVQEDENDGYWTGVLPHYIEVCDSIWYTPNDSKP